MRKYVDKDQAAVCERSMLNCEQKIPIIDHSQFTIDEKPNSDQNSEHFALLCAGCASQQKLDQGSKAGIIKNSLKYLLIQFLICNFSLPCTPFENLS